MHNAAFSHYGIDAVYELAELDQGDVGAFAIGARGEEWLGFQVTAPYKETIVPHLDVVEETARQIGAVNSAVREADGSLTGFNTDAPGFVAAVHEAGVAIAGSRAVVVGAGGAARAVVWALLSQGAREVVIGNRTFARAAHLAGSFSALGAVRGARDTELGEALAGCDIAVNATTVGMTSDETAFDVDALPGAAAVFDLVYVPPATPLVTAARGRGLTVRNGLDMLVNQAQIAFGRWTGIPDAAPVMRAALHDWIDGRDGHV